MFPWVLRSKEIESWTISYFTFPCTEKKHDVFVTKVAQNDPISVKTFNFRLFYAVVVPILDVLRLWVSTEFSNKRISYAAYLLSRNGYLLSIAQPEMENAKCTNNESFPFLKLCYFQTFLLAYVYWSRSNYAFLVDASSNEMRPISSVFSSCFFLALPFIFFVRPHFTMYVPIFNTEVNMFSGSAF